MGQPQRSERQVIAYLAFMGILLAFGIDASLPAFDQLSEAFGIEQGSTRISLIVTLYVVGMAVGQLFYGPLADRYGRVPALLSGVGLYSIGAIGAIAAPSLGWLFVSRFVWGLGAAAPGALRASIARDLYEGDQMARIIAVMMGVFMTGPIFAPVVGDVLVQIGNWQWVFAAALVLAGVQVVWTLRFGETLDPANRQPLRLGDVGRGFQSVFGSPATLRYTLALMSGYGAFIVFLGSSQPIIDNIYGRGEQFAFWFAIASVAMIGSFLSVNRFIVRYGSHRVAVGSGGIALIAAVALLVASLIGNGVPPFGLWFGLIMVANAFTTLLTPTCYSLALAPMGERSGTASGVMGFISTAGGAALAALVNAAIDDTVTPMALGYTVYGTCTLLLLWWASKARVDEPLLAVGSA